MGCGNSSPTINTDSSSAGRAEFPSKLSDESAEEDDKRKNYGGVYVGLPADLSNIPQVQIGSLRGFIRSGCLSVLTNVVLLCRDRQRLSVPQEASMGRRTVTIMNIQACGSL
ncbi:overexpressed in colon carcinoma 1 protein-like isoform X1 [Amphiprion ocellaris]|uniref:overexpressed in colon carcinoma 1 protein-like isoform X1 n=1 Tax=Amphiprion ocellaris TaxID=80972 RepID=UPI0024114108|nr:overexpressed in colon carcinoma 1 protein-like isoform X1 [Amphiprion ocellaris]